MKTFVSPVEWTNGNEDAFEFKDSSEREIMIHLPLYNKVKNLYIGLQKGSSFKKHTPYSNSQKVVYFGPISFG